MMNTNQKIASLVPLIPILIAMTLIIMSLLGLISINLAGAALSAVVAEIFVFSPKKEKYL